MPLLQGFRRSLSVLWKHARIRRLFKEDKYVEGVGWYARNRDDSWHVPLNILRVLVLVTFAPIYAILRIASVGRVAAFPDQYDDEPVCAPDAMLYKSPSVGGEGKFDPTGRRPKWMLKVSFRGGAKLKKKQVEQITVEDEEAEIDALRNSYSKRLEKS
ncbi:hypothetical protein P691DRAFT_815659 [Macrolepiota fuliginosa MF-IS2]|uniref:Uncharacterized protein n=1 Tax=Macrolepiota fuliginosa MF-IS2 TaxID=1400762 RepID=A0A9P5X085_9AGAR|nr:hypothetical protein P691DRAFT_815659 [Macrolepiota fuliginosa MF-IS2]